MRRKVERTSRGTRTNNRKRESFAFQRLMIVHQTLVVACIGHDLDEGASLEEQSEHILFYYDKNRSGRGAGDTVDDQDSQALLEAVQFAGLCEALYSLPTTLVSYSTENADKAKHAHFGKSTLVFVPLEHDVLAVVQIPRPSSREDDKIVHHGDGNTLAVHSSIQRCHEWFCLLRGGGVQHRLSMQTDDDETSEKTSVCVYPGMPELFDIRKRRTSMLRKLESEHGSEDCTENTKTEFERIDKEIEKLLQTLPIQSLRKDLSIHYDEFLSEMEAIENSGWVSSCCLVDHVPIPGLSASSSHLQQSTMGYVDNETSDLLTQCSEKLLRIAADCHSKPALVGVSSFFDGELIRSFVSLHSSSKSKDNQDDRFRILLEPEHAKMIYNNMSSFRRKVHRNAMVGGEPSNSQPPSPLRRNQKDASSCDGTATDEKCTDSHPKGYVEPPPLCMLSASDQIFEVDLPSLGTNKTAWTPRIHVPFESSATNKSYKYGVTETYVALYEVDCYGFLLFMKPGEITREYTSSVDESKKSTSSLQETALRDTSKPTSLESATELLEFVSDKLLSFLDTTHSPETDVQVESSIPHSKSIDRGRLPEWYEQGQDIVFVDRREQKLTLITGREFPQNRDSKAGKLSLNLFGAKRRGWKSDGTTLLSNLPPDKTDCRHLLASLLPLGVIQAFDDMMTSVHDLSYSKDQNVFNFDKESPQRHANRKVQDGALEFCTFLPNQGWIYAHVHDERETYIMFDATEYVTIADVESAAVHVHRNLLHERL